VKLYLKYRDNFSIPELTLNVFRVNANASLISLCKPLFLKLARNYWVHLIDVTSDFFICIDNFFDNLQYYPSVLLFLVWIGYFCCSPSIQMTNSWLRALMVVVKPGTCMRSLMERREGETFQRRSKCLFLRTSKLGHLCASSSALWRAPENVLHVNFTQYWKSIVFLNNSAISFSLVSDFGLISLSDGHLFTDFFVLVSVHLNDKFLHRLMVVYQSCKVS